MANERSNSIEYEKTKKGYIFKYKGKISSCYNDPASFNSVEIAKEIGADPEEVLKLTLEIYEKELKKEMDINELAKILGLTIKHDNVNKVITFLCMITAYTSDSQFNISFRSESSTGKSYIPLEIAALFPEEDVIKIAYSSPTAFFHEAGQWNEEEQCINIDLSRKILIFIDQPHDQLLQRLRPLLSHDQKELLYKITDKKERKGLRTKNVKIIGYPSVIFCTGKLRIEDQEATRMILLSPETSQEKLREAIILRAKREGNPIEFKEYLEKDPERKLLMIRIKKIKEANIQDIIIPNEEEIAKRFLEERKYLKPRHSRDISRLFSIIKALALFNMFNRKCDGQTLYANEKDIRNGFKLYSIISESQELGIAPFVYQIYKEIIIPLCDNPAKEGIYYKEICDEYFRKYGRPLSYDLLKKNIIPSLEGAGLIVKEPDPSDRRKQLIKLAANFDNEKYGNEKGVVDPSLL